MDIKNIEYRILYRLYRGCYRAPARPMNFDDLYGGVPKHVPRRMFIESCKTLVSNGLIIQKPGEFGPRFGLNPSRKMEIEEIISSHI